MPDPVVTVTVNGNQLKVWKEVTIKRSMEEGAHSFSLRYWDNIDLQNRPLPIHAGDAVEIDIDGKLVVTGFVDETKAEETKNDYVLDFAGRSLAGDLVDCAAIYESGSWTEQSILAIASNIAQPFNISVSADPAVATDVSSPIASFTIQDGETGFEALSRLGRYAGVLPVSDSTGNIRFARAGNRRTATQLQRGLNLKGGVHSVNGRERFSQYIVKAQSPGTDEWNGSQAAQISATVQDDQVKRYRPMIFIADFNGAAGVENRATWERNVRAGRMHRYTFNVGGWRNAEALWSPNVLVHVIHDRFGLDDDLLILSATLKLDGADGRRTELELGHPDGYGLEGLPPPKRGKRHRRQPKATVRT